MRIVIGNNTLAGPGGTETYTLTVAEQLQRLAHEVWIHANEQGALADRARGRGLRVPEHAAQLPDEVDAVLVNDAITAIELAERYPRAPLVLIGHSEIFDSHLPPRLEGLLAGVVVLYDRVARRLQAMDLGVPITRLTQPIDVEHFKPLRGLPERAARVLVMGNYVHGERMAMIERACKANGLECVQAGVLARAGGQTLEPVVTLSEADIVLGKARVVLEAMACGRAVYTLDHNGGDGWVTADSYAVQAGDNFGGQATDEMIDERKLVADLAGYDRAMGLVNRDLVIRHHAATHHAGQLAALLVELAPRPVPVPGPLTEMARLVRTAWQHEGHAFSLYAEAERLQRQLHEIDVVARDAARAVERLTLQLAAAEQRAGEAEERCRAAEASAAQARADGDAAGAVLERFRQTRRFAIAGVIAAPLDRVRSLTGKAR